MLKKCRKSDDILFINAAECYDKGKKQNVLTPNHIDQIVEAYRTRQEKDRFSRRVSLKEIHENDYNLNITRYVSLAQEEAQIDLEANHALLTSIDADIADAKAKLNVYLKELGFQPSGTTYLCFFLTSPNELEHKINIPVTFTPFFTTIKI